VARAAVVAPAELRWADVEADLGSVDAAKRLVEAALATFRASGMARWEAHARVRRAGLMLLDRDLAAAETGLRQAVALTALDPAPVIPRSPSTSTSLVDAHHLPDRHVEVASRPGRGS